MKQKVIYQTVCLHPDTNLIWFEIQNFPMDSKQSNFCYKVKELKTFTEPPPSIQHSAINLTANSTETFPIDGLLSVIKVH